MNPFAIIMGMLLLAGSLIYVAAPFRTGAYPVKLKTQASKTSQSLQADHQAVILSLRDLDFDYRAGKISEEDYPSLRAGLLDKAALTLKDLEDSSDARLEKLIQARRMQRGSSEKAGGISTHQENGVCINCHAPLNDGANFCMKCGTPVQHTFCPHCGKLTLRGDQFCPTCGKAIPQPILS